MEMDRRSFIHAVAGTLASLTATGCASVAVARLTPSNGSVRLPLATYPQLQESGGALTIDVDGQASPFFVLALDDGEFAVLSPICTHLGCTVDVEGGVLVCPCHGSTYDRSGAVLRGPAELPLRRMPASVTRDGVLIIQVEGQS